MSAVYEPPVHTSLDQTLLASHTLEKTSGGEVEVHSRAENHTNLQLASVLESIESDLIREAVQPVFGDLLRFLDCLNLFQGFFSQTDQAHDTLAIFELVRVEARSVMTNIRSLTMQTDLLDEPLRETLDGIAFAIGHDLHRAFDCQLSELTDEAPAELVIGELVHSHGLLTNCAQESIITLAQQFDFKDASLFEDCTARRTESLQLCRDLTDLIEFVGGWQETHDELAATAVVEQVAKFRHGSMRLLMYRDWKEYEIFSARVTLASADHKALGPVLHAFGCYLETLLRLVSSRSVLAPAASELSPADLECLPLEQ